MLFNKKIFTLAVVLAGLASPALAEDRGTADEALQMLERAHAHFKAVGPEQAYKDFSSKSPDWHDRDLYLFCFDRNSVTLAHGANEKLLGKNLAELKDPDGKFFVAELVKAGLSGGGWVDYRWPNPVTKKIEAKSSNAKQFGEDSVCGIGIYK